jgi:hypothetical protein
MDPMTELTQRLNAQGAPPAAEPAPGEPAPAAPAPAPEPAPSPTPAPSPEAPPVPTAPPAVDQKLLEAERALALARAQIDQQRAEIEERRLEEQVRKNRKIELPKEELWEEDPAKARRMLTEHTKEALVQLEVDLRKEFNASLVRMGADVVELRQTSSEQQVLKAFPHLQLEKYRPAWEAKMAEKDLTAVEAMRLVADPADLMPQAAPSTTPGQSPVAHMEGGRPTRSPTMPAPSTPKPTDEQRLRAASELADKGDTQGAKAVQLNVLRDRLTQQAQAAQAAQPPSARP